MSTVMEKQHIKEEIMRLKTEKDALILAHNYQVDEVQDIADYVGDSFGLSQMASESKNEVIVFCGVHFMAESAKILAPEKTVLLPEKMAGCPMADMVTPEALRNKKKELPEAKVVSYVNTSAAVKAESDICVTSSNAVRVVESLDAEDIIFVPDQNLGDWVQKLTGKKMHLWPGYCLTHHRVTLDDVNKARKMHPDAVMMVHPECRPEVVAAADTALSTGGMLEFAAQTEYKKIIVGTEMGLLYRLKKENPDKEFLLLSQGLICPNMKYTSLEKVNNALETLSPVITVAESIREKAYIALEKMLAIH